MNLFLIPTNLSEGFQVKWWERCRGVESIDCKIDEVRSNSL